MIKSTTRSTSWTIKDSTRNVSNPVKLTLYANSTSAETSELNIDFLSNGFKLRNSNNTTNTGDTYIYAAFAEHPFGGSNVSPATAR